MLDISALPIVATRLDVLPLVLPTFLVYTTMLLVR